MTRLLVHAGFHKTGTSTVQAMLDRDRAILSPHLRVFLKHDFEALAKAARRYSADRDPETLAAVRALAEAFFATLDAEDPRPVLISSEDLSGLIPGRRGLTRYDAAPVLLAQVAAAARATISDDPTPVLYFSTRGAEGWLRSAWWQSLRVTRLTDDFPDFAKVHAGAADFAPILRDVADAAAPCTVESAALEDSADTRHGPLTPILDLLDLPGEVRDAIRPGHPANAQPVAGLANVFLALNRSGFRDTALARAKAQLRQMANRQSKAG